MELTFEQALQQGAAAHNQGDLQEAERLYRAILQALPAHPEANYNLGLIAISVNKVEAALPLFKIAVRENPKIEQFWLSYIETLIKDNQRKNAKKAIKKAQKHGFDVKKLKALAAYTKISVDSKRPYQAQLNNLLELFQAGKYGDAEKLALSLNQEFPDQNFSWKILGAVLKNTGRLSEAVFTGQKAVEINPSDLEAHHNLGNTLRDLGRFEEAETSYKQAIAVQPDSAETYNNLGTTQKELGRLGEAEVSYKKAIALKPDYADAHSNLGVTLYGIGNVDAAITSMKRANFINPKSRGYSLFLSILNARKARKNSDVNLGNGSHSNFNLQLPRKIFMLARSVEDELLAYLYKLESIDLKKVEDPTFGDTRGSLYSLFHDDHPTIKYLKEDLEDILTKFFSSDILIDDSFFSIFGAGGGTIRHNHIKSTDNDSILGLAKQKYSLVYYLSVGDQNCSEPGTLMFYEPREDVLPTEGLITIFPSDRDHSSVYGGSKDRVLVGVNFYCL